LSRNSKSGDFILAVYIWGVTSTKIFATTNYPARYILYRRVFLLTTILLETVSHLLPAKIPLHPFLSMQSFYILFIVAESSIAIFVICQHISSRIFFQYAAEEEGKQKSTRTKGWFSIAAKYSSR
jgi:hypothetical protein